mmetsp:Transcript_78460/g.227751  ORF Transcript_78460/g.227751 Transcript_78460/m.227751 type:complete len:213 (+) Transcript_78460:105-743(+)|eukprot:CAMPEP_0176069902 /NCGR_PEP_ID=MMETSP0120_2-20121206/34904_1 /TAXON_ID=160619 /ORGANISM="Kryptoperidinium foliaceum, Strain CCMP 1326" /LENGTH=212 /DNA_ID=CAMNT_0017403541 /DNA_START=19 /DNA_END=657 /DNA_ORIENTATION=-
MSSLADKQPTRSWGPAVAACVVAACYLQYQAATSNGADLLPDATAATPVYSSETLRRYNGEGGEGKILLAVWGRVFDVTSGSEFYAVGEGYHVFAGHDCTRAFALGSTKAKWLDRDLEGLSDAKLRHLNETYWGTYVAKYPVVGRLTDPPYDPAAYDAYAGPIAALRVARESGQAAPAQGKRKSKCPVTNAFRAMGRMVASMLPMQLAPPEA